MDKKIIMTQKSKSIFLSAMSGNILEYYDFTVYSIFSIAIGRAFFPGDNEFIQILSSLAVFAVGFFTRPIGGIVFGYIADTYGRRMSLITSMLSMTISTFIIGLIPEYSQIGSLAPVILIIMRLIQGISISGEGAGAAVFILEHQQNLKPGFTAGLVHASGIAGTLFATLVGLTFSVLIPEINYSWRFAFILGGIMGIMGFYIRLKVSETPIFQMLAQKKKTLKMPFINMLKTAKKSVFITLCLGGCASSIVYLIKSYITIYHCNILHYCDTISRAYVAYSAIIMMISMPISGYISDHIGRFRMLTYSVLAIFILVLPAFILLSCDNMIKQLIALTMLSVLGGTVAGTAYIFIISLFTPEQRFTGVAFSYNLGIALFGGTSAAISRWLLEITGLHYAPAFYIMFTSGSFLLIIYSMRNSIRLSLNAATHENLLNSRNKE